MQVNPTDGGAYLDQHIASSKEAAAGGTALQGGGCVVLHEIENGVRRVTKRISKRKPVEEYLKYQGRLAHLLKDAEALAAIQQSVDDGFEATMAKM